MKHLYLFIELARLNKPIGYMLLFWPCLWGLTLVYNFNEEIITYIKYIILFFLGSVMMRSAGCIVNDISDQKFDKKVDRTKNRPIASGKISTKLAWFYTLILCFIAFLVLINFNLFTIFLAIGSMPLAFTYPLMKRYTYWPQLFLGITFNYGLLMGWTSINSQVEQIPLIFYVGAIFWTLGYDTIYGYQDLKDDEIIGLKSTAIKFKSNPFSLLIICYSIFTLALITIGYLMRLNELFFISMIIIFFHMFYFQIKKLKIDDATTCLKTFKSNNFLGLLVYVGLVIGKI